MDEVFVVGREPEFGPMYAKAVGDIIHKHDVDLLLPVNSREIRNLLSQKHLLRDALWYTGDYSLFRILDDKKQFGELLRELGLPHPRVCNSLNFRGRAVVKPTRDSSAKGVAYVEVTGERFDPRLDAALHEGDYLLQEFVEGEGVGYSGYFQDGRVAVGYAHRRVSEYPTSGGSSVVRERYPYADKHKLDELVSSVLKVVPWTGFAMFEFKRTPQGELVFIECNPRIWGSMHQGLADGINYFEPLLGPSLYSVSPAKRGVRTELFPLSLIALAAYLLRGRLKEVLGMRKVGVPHLFDVSPFKDPRGFLALCLRITKKR